MPTLLRDAVYDACESRGYPPVNVSRQYGQLYTIAVFDGPWAPGKIAGFDPEDELNRFVSCSQLIHPTTVGFANTATLTFDHEGRFLEAHPGRCRGVTEHAYTITERRNWLTASECSDVKTLLAKKYDELPERVKRANWNFQFAMFQYFFEVRSLLIITAFEALLHTKDIRVQKKGRSMGPRTKFVRRITALASMLELPIEQADAEFVYDHRSVIAHGGDPWAARRASGEVPTEVKESEPVVRGYDKIESLLRKTIARCMQDATFSSHFYSDATVKLAFPLS